MDLIVTSSKKTLSTMTPGITLKCHCVEYHFAECHYAEYHYAECHYAECHIILLLCWMSLCWVPLCWEPLCWMPFYLMSQRQYFFNFLQIFLFSFSEPPSLRETGADHQTPRRWRRRRATENAAIRWGIRTGDPRSEPPAAKWEKMNAGNANRGGRLSTVDLLFIAVGRFVKKLIIFLI